MAVNTSYAAVHYNAGFIVLSYFISLVGCITTLELLHRRTSRRGLYNWFLLIAGCICMGGIGIWSMHFIGNRAIVIGDNEADIQILYSRASTAASFFLPIIVLLLAFYLLGVLDRGNWYFIGFSAVATGAAVCGMHYVGQLGITNYSISYSGQYVAGAGVISVFASFIALSVFFKLRETYTDSWWKRSFCAAILAGAVSGMHWTAAAGTVYSQFRGVPSAHSARSREQTVIVCAVLSIVACVLLLGLTMVRGYKKKVSRNLTRQLVLACAYFDEHGRIMVTPEGWLPCEKIADHYIEKTFGEDELNRTHPSFVWVYKASRNWAALKDLIPGMKESIESDPKSRRYYPAQGVPSDTTSTSSSEDFSGMFKKLFCVAALALANALHEPIETLGPLFEEPLETGTLSNKKSFSPLTATRDMSLTKQSDIERASVSAPALLGKGQYFFLDKQLNKIEVVKYGAHGFRFAAPKQIAESLAASLQIPSDVMLKRLDRMRMYCSKESLLPAGIHLACFFLRPSVRKSFDLLVPTKTQNLLPHILHLVPQDTDRDQVQQDMEKLKTFDEWTVGDILKTLVHQSSSLRTGETFRWGTYRAFSQLVDLMADPEVMMKAKFSAKKISAPCRQANDGRATSTCTLYSVRHIASIEARSPKAELAYVPLSFFSAQQQLEASPWSHEIFAKQAHLEFAYLAKSKAPIPIPIDSKTESRKASVVELSFPPTPTSVVRPSFATPYRATSPRRLSEETETEAEMEEAQQNENDMASDTSNDERIELTTRVRHNHSKNLSMGSLRDPGVEDTGTFVSQLFALFKL